MMGPWWALSALICFFDLTQPPVASELVTYSSLTNRTLAIMNEIAQIGLNKTLVGGITNRFDWTDEQTGSGLDRFLLVRRLSVGPVDSGGLTESIRMAKRVGFKAVILGGYSREFIDSHLSMAELLELNIVALFVTDDQAIEIERYFLLDHTAATQSTLAYLVPPVAWRPPSETIISSLGVSIGVSIMVFMLASLCGLPNTGSGNRQRRQQRRRRRQLREPINQDMSHLEWSENDPIRVAQFGRQAWRVSMDQSSSDWTNISDDDNDNDNYEPELDSHAPTTIERLSGERYWSRMARPLPSPPPHLSAHVRRLAVELGATIETYQRPSRADNKIGAHQQVVASTCSICLTDFRPSETVRRLSCKHCFHDRCIYSWFSVQFNCPVCRRDFTLRRMDYVA